MLLVHPVHEVLRQVPLLIGAVVLGSATGNSMWSIAVLALMIVFGVARWFTTTYRIDAEQIQRREGVLQRSVLSVPRNRIRSVSTDARVLHRLLGLTVVKVSTGQEARGDTGFALDAIRSDEVPALRALLIADSPPDALEAGSEVSAGERVLARWEPSWLRYSPLSFTGLAMIAAVVGVIYQTGAVAALEDSPLARQGLDAAERFGVVATVVVAVLVVLTLGVMLSVVRSLITFGNLVLSRRDEVLHLQHGLLRVREHTYDMGRLRGGTIRQPLLVRAFGGARLDAVMTGVDGAGEASLLLPPCPAATVEGVLAQLIGAPTAVTGELRHHGPAATRRRWTRAMTFPALLVVGLVAAAVVATVPAWAWVLCGVVIAAGAFLAADRSLALGHRVGDGWLVARSGSLDRRRDCLEAAGIIGWTARQTLFQRRAGVATLIAATPAGVKGYRVLDVPADLAWSVAAAASPWVADCDWTRENAHS
jgi:putative membrane protein